MTWTGPNDGSEDIWQYGEAINRIKSGYTALFSLSTYRDISICTGSINNNLISNGCEAKVVSAQPESYRIVSSGDNGGFCVKPSGLGNSNCGINRKP